LPTLGDGTAVNRAETSTEPASAMAPVDVNAPLPDTTFGGPEGKGIE
jgi:hypothetical protein